MLSSLSDTMVNDSDLIVFASSRHPLLQTVHISGGFSVIRSLIDILLS